MNFHEFSIGMQRLVSQFGKAAYGDERVKLIFREVEFLPAASWSRIVDKFLGEARMPPLLPEFRTEISLERERLHRAEKAQHAEDAFELAKRYPPDELTAICDTIRNRIKGRLSDSEFDSFTAVLEKNTK